MRKIGNFKIFSHVKWGTQEKTACASSASLSKYFVSYIRDRLGREVVIDMVKVRNGKMRANSGITKSPKKGISSLNVNVNQSAYFGD